MNGNKKRWSRRYLSTDVVNRAGWMGDTRTRPLYVLVVDSEIVPFDLVSVECCPLLSTSSSWSWSVVGRMDWKVCRAYVEVRLQGETHEDRWVIRHNKQNQRNCERHAQRHTQHTHTERERALLYIHTYIHTYTHTYIA